MLQPLSIVWDFDPVFFSIGSFDIRYYGVMWALAILIGAKLFDNFVKREGLPSSVSESIFIYGTLATIIGARLGHCLFYDPVEYLRQPWTIITGFGAKRWSQMFDRTNSKPHGRVVAVPKISELKRLPSRTTAPPMPTAIMMRSSDQM